VGVESEQYRLNSIRYNSASSKVVLDVAIVKCFRLRELRKWMTCGGQNNCIVQCPSESKAEKSNRRGLHWCSSPGSANSDRDRLAGNQPFLARVHFNSSLWFFVKAACPIQTYRMGLFIVPVHILLLSRLQNTRKEVLTISNH
jgi:hypothetical protein